MSDDDERGKCAKCGCNLIFMPEMHPSSEAVCSYCELTTLRAENERLKKDKERLD